MPIIREGENAREILREISNSGRSLPCFCTESVYTTEAIFRGAKRFKDQENIEGSLPLIIAFTASYKDRQQLRNYTGLGDLREGLLAVKSDIERLSREDGPYQDLDVIVHLDHAQPGEDLWIIEENSDFISSVMWDCSFFSMEDNISMMKNFTQEYKSRFVIEGAVDEIYNYSTEHDSPELIDRITEPALAEKYYYETGCDLIVANLGTEHRRTEGTVEYHRKVATDIAGRIGRKLVLHGTSSLDEKDLSGLAEDGIVKVNLWGKLESEPGRKLAENIIRELENILTADQVRLLVDENFVHPDMSKKTYRPSIHFLTEKYRRDEIYLPEAEDIVAKIYKTLY